MIDAIGIGTAIILGYAMFFGSMVFLVKLFFPFVHKKKLEAEII